MALTVKSLIAVIIIMQAGFCFGNSVRKMQPEQESVCFVADSIRMHNSLKALTWSPYSPTPRLMSRRRHPYKTDFQIFVTETIQAEQVVNIINIAHPMNDGSCRFLIKKNNKFTFSSAMPCNPNAVGHEGIFTTSLDGFTDRYQIRFGSRPVSTYDHAFLGARGSSLQLASLRSRTMAWWKISFNARKTCTVAY